MIENIILTEDDADDIMFFQYALSEIGYNYSPYIAKNSDELFTILNNMTKPPEIIFLDINMPGTDGLESLQLLREKPSLTNCKVVILTTTNSKDIIETCRNLGADLFATKPSSLNELVSMLKKILIDNVPFDFLYK
ncbi:response regulator [Flavobacterium sp. DG1-102-2]|uniref:response regulator n=1 Tax=Flavobacterium sp. DG1-102-2 TaxID=3081663 RepID=UPI002949F824|nr:response regulator [Flavobacterium sp. DG1-102-2]MDV6167900.1 response regulator [Flavobacterium sp. DG1-102-2]